MLRPCAHETAGSGKSTASQPIIQELSRRDTTATQGPPRETPGERRPA
jgi:hypothetical protein